MLDDVVLQASLATESGSRAAQSTFFVDPLPTPYLLFFAIIEPLLTLIGAGKAIFTTSTFYSELYPVTLAPRVDKKAIPAAATMAVRQLGNTYFLVATISLFMLPTLKRTLKEQPKALETILSTFFSCLAFADLTHIASTLFDLGVEGALSPAKHWNQLVWGNVGITATLFAVRMMWLSGLGRATTRLDKRRA